MFESLPIVIVTSAAAAAFVAFTALSLLHRVRIRRHLHRLQRTPVDRE